MKLDCTGLKVRIFARATERAPNGDQICIRYSDTQLLLKHFRSGNESPLNVQATFYQFM